MFAKQIKEKSFVQAQGWKEKRAADNQFPLIEHPFMKTPSFSFTTVTTVPIVVACTTTKGGISVTHVDCGTISGMNSAWRPYGAGATTCVTRTSPTSC